MKETYLIFILLAVSLISACDSSNSSNIEIIPVTTLEINQPPILTDQTKSDLAYNANVSFNLSASDIDSPTSSYAYHIISQATHGQVVITDHATSAFEYQPSSATAVVSDSFTVQLSDGQNVSSIATITLSFNNTSTGIQISGSPSTSVNEESLYNFIPIIDSNPVGNAVFSIINKPAWANFNTTTGALTGTPGDEHNGIASNITIIATDDIASSNIGPFSIIVNAINDAPVLVNQTKSGLAFSSNVSFNLSASDIDSPTNSYIYSIISPASHGTVVITNHTTSAFEYQPSSVSGISGDSFTVQLSDGHEVSNIRTITLSFSDTSAPALTLSPNHGAANVAADTSFGITSDDPLDTTTLTYNSTAGACTGSVKISKDNFINCIGITSKVVSNLNRSITLTGAEGLDDGTEYKMKITTAAKNLFGLSLGSDISYTFNTATNGLLITEVGESGDPGDQRWFEIYNASSSIIDISAYSVRSRHIAISNLIVNGNGSYSYSYSLPGNHTFSLPSKNIQPGQYMLIWSTHIVDAYTPNSRDVYINDGSNYPYWDTTGFIELVKAGITKDFITFGSSYTPITATAWVGTFSTALPSVNAQYGHSIGRNGTNNDSNTSSDWSSYSFSTMGGANDVTCTTDTDADGIPDCSEVSGSTFAGLPLYEWGARVNQKDIFIELDYMEATNSGGQTIDEGIIPRREALQKVVDVFNAQGISIHFDVGDLYDQAPGIDAADFDLGGGQEVPFAAGMSFDPSDGRANTYDYKRDYMDYSRMQIFHYLVFANSQTLGGGQGSSGLAEFNGNDLIVTLGDWGLNSNNLANTNALINYQASTLMHELGHNLGLSHGGDDTNNFEPNYLSIMNYLYQLTGLPTIASDEGDRFYDSTTYHNRNVNCYSGLSNDPYTSTFIIDFSHGDGINLNLSSVNETLGLGQANTDGVDYNCDGDKSDTSVSYGGGSGTHTDHDDWGNLNLNFQHYFSGNNSGESLLTTPKLSNEDKLMPDKIGNDRAPIVQELSPSKEFFQRLKEQSIL